MVKSRYNSFANYFKEKYGSRMQKIVIDAGFTCPNRDGTLATGGCTFCDNNAFHPSYSTPEKPVKQQIEEGMEFHRKRYRRADGFLAYFQSYSNTYAELPKLKSLYSEALSHPEVVGIVVGTRPDCMDDEKLDYFKELSAGKIVILEYGIESCYNRTLERVNRQHNFKCAVDMLEKGAKRGLLQGAHFIFGLPGESIDDMMRMADIINGLPLHSVKFHQLQIIKGTAMESDYRQNKGDFVKFTLEGYLDFFIDFLERLRPDLYIERFAGEVPPRFVNETPWGEIRNVELLRMLDKRLAERDSWQGKQWQGLCS